LAVLFHLLLVGRSSVQEGLAFHHG
jgi:hypothetical protein